MSPGSRCTWRNRRAAPLALAGAIVVACCARSAHADAPQTWGVPESDAADREDATSPVETPLPRQIPGDEDAKPYASPSPARAAKSEPEREAAAGQSGALRYALDGVEVRGNRTTLARVVLRYVPFHAGDVIDVTDPAIEQTRFRLLGTGFFRDVHLSLRKGTRRGAAVLVIEVEERNTLLVNDVWLGLSADATTDGRARPLTAYGGVDVAETNLAGTGVTLGGAVAVADQQLGLRARFADPQFLGSEWMTEAELLHNRARDFFGNRDVLVDDALGVSRQDVALLTYQRFGGLVGAGRYLGLRTRLFLDYRLERLDASYPRAASHRRGVDVEPIEFDMLRGESVLSTARATLFHDTRDQPFLANRGEQLVLLTEASLTPFGSDYPFTKLQGRGAKWVPLPWGHVLKLEAFVGAIVGEAPLFEKYNVGDLSDLLPDRVLGLNFDRRTAPSLLGTQVKEVRYGQYAARATVEYRLPIYRGQKSIYGVDLFASTGLYALADHADLARPARGYTGLARVPLDVNFNGGLRVWSNAGAFSIGVSNWIGFLPVRGAGP